jgi:hypothetical protein
MRQAANNADDLRDCGIIYKQKGPWKPTQQFPLAPSKRIMANQQETGEGCPCLAFSRAGTDMGTCKRKVIGVCGWQGTGEGWRKFVGCRLVLQNKKSKNF